MYASGRYRRPYSIGIKDAHFPSRRRPGFSSSHSRATRPWSVFCRDICEIKSLRRDNCEIKSLRRDNCEIKSLRRDICEIKSLRRDNCEIKSLRRDICEIKSLRRDICEIKSLRRDNCEIKSLRRDNCEIKSLRRDICEIKSLRRDICEIKSLRRGALRNQLNPAGEGCVNKFSLAAMSPAIVRVRSLTEDEPCRSLSPALSNLRSFWRPVAPRSSP
ncbi:hypothetical protein N7450_011504 [Penicillium hetheringtonii]|uniref:Uncharacterized protein n=1 Tax=Penicillium hetheringtonii TaxID=911720 RepID=A0AAD6DAD9_9EURO|nr:hypothetical protein N7450_011504 [Penicillium hetheringtonii]